MHAQLDDGPASPFIYIYISFVSRVRRGYIDRSRSTGSMERNGCGKRKKKSGRDGKNDSLIEQVALGISDKLVCARNYSPFFSFGRAAVSTWGRLVVQVVGRPLLLCLLFLFRLRVASIKENRRRRRGGRFLYRHYGNNKGSDLLLKIAGHYHIWLSS